MNFARLPLRFKVGIAFVASGDLTHRVKTTDKDKVSKAVAAFRV